MPERNAYAPGTPSYVDLSTTDPDAARSFYGALFGWDFEIDPSPEAGGYAAAQKNGKHVAGVFQQQKEHADMGMPPAWNTYVTVENVDAMPDKVTAAGGQVLAPPFDVMGAGRMSVIMDPTGAAIALWQKKEAIGCELVNEHGTFTWAELMTPDVDKAVELLRRRVRLEYEARWTWVSSRTRCFRTTARTSPVRCRHRWTACRRSGRSTSRSTTATARSRRPSRTERPARRADGHASRAHGPAHGSAGSGVPGHQAGAPGVVDPRRDQRRRYPAAPEARQGNPRRDQRRRYPAAPEARQGNPRRGSATQVSCGARGEAREPETRKAHHGN